MKGLAVSNLAGELLGVSDAMAHLRAVAPKIARSESTTLITGSTGTGKEHVARTLHRLSPRSQSPFIAVNCSAIPEALFESELFGFERGSFTGAFHAQQGKAVLANGGTLFLDEVGELSPFCQAKLLRMLEEREAQPIGAARPVKLNVRIVAATNQRVEQLVEQGRFRTDLYYRLNVARIAIPDLASRPEDLGAYLSLFIENYNRERRAKVAGPDDELLDLLAHYEWPGNVREVRNFVEAVFIDPPDGPIGVRHIPEAFTQLRASYRTAGVDESERILEALERTNWNKAEAARSLHWSRMTLYRKITKYHIGRGGLQP
jgi:two-component system response regulator HydG